MLNPNSFKVCCQYGSMPAFHQIEASSIKHQASNIKHQASSIKHRVQSMLPAEIHLDLSGAAAKTRACAAHSTHLFSVEAVGVHMTVTVANGSSSCGMPTPEPSTAPALRYHLRMPSGSSESLSSRASRYFHCASEHGPCLWLVVRG